MGADLETLVRQETLRGHSARLRWLIQLRWVAVFGVAAASLTTELAGYRMLTLPPWLLVPFVLIYNTSFWFWLRRVKRCEPSLPRLERSLRWQAYLQAGCDMLAMILLVYLDGGIEYPLFYAPLLALMLSSLLLPRLGLFVQANLGAALFALMAVGEYLGWIPHLELLQQPFRQGLYRERPVVLAIVLSLALMLNLTAYLMSSLGQGLNRAETQSRVLLARLRQQVGEAAGRLAGSAESMQQNAQEVNYVAEQIAVTVQEISRGAGEQAGQLEKLTHALGRLTGTSRQVVEGALETHQAAQEAVSTAEQGRQAAREAHARMDEVAHVFAQAEGALDGLADRSEEIAEVALTIDHFAERTDLLALNAGIEAARAGEHGRGFAVVAGEVKKLAASSSASAEQVAAIVGQVQDEIQRVLQAVQDGMARVQDGQQSIAVLEAMVGGMGDIIARTDELAGAMRHLSLQQKEAQGEISRSVEGIASTAEQTAAGSEETAAAVEQQVASFADFGHSLQELAQLAAELERLVTGLYQDANLKRQKPSGRRSGA
ncbi:MAG: methyl-accepting chemotaxis protein [Chloroflexia bacterium]|nr:methyl-accepting chemotaxis protein [Chloroflexia bacterium]